MIDTDLLIAYEEGTLEREDFLKLFQQIYDSRAYTWLQGHYGRTLSDLAQAGLINLK
jgi:hypothetical protein|tara:strand:- start:2131 stop:2301 length:171 start_codon:yes stop_codon:yes gene_type:complete